MPFGGRSGHRAHQFLQFIVVDLAPRITTYNFALEFLAEPSKQFVWLIGAH
jgi:hypothetical protein